MTKSADSLVLTQVINTYENPRALDAIIERLVKGTRAPGEIVVADDGSGAGTKGVIDAWRARAKFPVRHAWQEKKGYRRSRILNLAIAQSTGDYIVFMDGDCLPGARFVEDHLKAAEQGCFVQGRRAYVRESEVEDVLEGRRSLAGAFFRGKMHGVAKGIRLPVPVVMRDQDLHKTIGCNLAVWRDDLVAINGYDEAYEGWGAEDSDLVARLYHLGRQRKRLYGRAVMYHLDHPRLARTHYADNRETLELTLSEKRVRCEKGLAHHLETSGSATQE